MRIRPARPATWVRPRAPCGADCAAPCRRSSRCCCSRRLPGCRAELVPPGAPTPWPAASARRGSGSGSSAARSTPPSRRTSSCSTRCAPPPTETQALRSRDRRLICQVRVGTYAAHGPATPAASRRPSAAPPGRPAGQPVAGRTAVGHAGAGAGRPVPALPGQGLRRGGARRRRRLPAPARFPARLRRPTAVQPAAGRARPVPRPLPRPGQRRAAGRRAGARTSTSRSTRSASGWGVRQAAAVRRRRQAGLPRRVRRRPDEFCVTTVGYGFASIRKDRALDAWRETCPLP